MTGARLVVAFGLALLLAACGTSLEEEQPTPEAGLPARQAGQPVVVVRPTPGTPAATVVPATPSSAGTPSCYQPTPQEPAIEGTPVEPSERIASPGAVPTPSHYEPLPLQEDAALEARLRGVLGDDVEAYGVVVKSLDDGRGALINSDKVFYAASLFKVAVMYEVFHQRSLGLLSFDERLLVTPYYAGFDLGTLPVEVCQTLSVGEALGYMMSISDNTSAVLLQDRVGSANINRSLEALGLTTTRLLPEDLPTTPADMALLMEMIARGKAVDAGASQEMVNLLASEEIDNGLRAGVASAEGGLAPGGGGEGTLVAHKTGNWSNATHDVGIVYLPAGQKGLPAAQAGSPAAAYVIAVLSEKAHETELTAEVSRVTWEYYNGRADGEEGE
jgi:beta-lactamase class A